MLTVDSTRPKLWFLEYQIGRCFWAFFASSELLWTCSNTIHPLSIHKSFANITSVCIFCAAQNFYSKICLLLTFGEIGAQVTMANRGKKGIIHPLSIIRSEYHPLCVSSAENYSSAELRVRWCACFSALALLLLQQQVHMEQQQRQQQQVQTSQLSKNVTRTHLSSRQGFWLKFRNELHMIFNLCVFSSSSSLLRYDINDHWSVLSL